MSEAEWRMGPSSAGVVAISTLCATLVSGGLLWADRQFGLFPVGRVTVPNFEGQRLAAVQSWAEDHGLSVRISDRKAIPDTDADTILHQRPLGGSQLARGQSLDLTVSGAVALRTVPEVLGLPEATARAQLEASGLTVGARRLSHRGQPGRVSAIEPAAGAVVPAGTAIALEIGQKEVVVPRLRGQRLHRARSLIEGAGLKVGRIRYDLDEDVGALVVLSQRPRSGTALQPGTPVDLVVNED